MTIEETAASRAHVHGVVRRPGMTKPILWSDWQQLEQQALRTCQMTGETYRDSKRCNMPDWFMERVARNWYRAKRRYWRIKRGNEARLNRGLVNLLSQIGWCEEKIMTETKRQDEHSGSPACYAIPRVVEDLWNEMHIRGRHVNPIALWRLVKYWKLRTRFTTAEICDFFRDDVRNGWLIGMSKRGFR